MRPVPLQRALQGASEPPRRRARRAIRPYVGAQAADVPRDRLLFLVLGLLCLFALLGGRLVWLGLQDYGGTGRAAAHDGTISAARPDILDRTGTVMAMDIKVSSMWAEPVSVQDPGTTFERLTAVFPDLPRDRTLRKLGNRRSLFQWLRREVTPEQEAAVMRLGLPGIHFIRESRRFYPGGRTAAHVTGHVDVDNRGIAGIEKHLDNDGLADLQSAGFARAQLLEPVRLSIDMRVQHIVHDALVDAVKRYRAIAATGTVLDAETGEIVALVSLPDYDPNRPGEARDHLNRVTKGRFEMGSTFKVFTTAMALEAGTARLHSRWDARQPIRVQGKRIGDFHAARRILSTREVFVKSSNIGTVRMAQTVGPTAHRAFLEKLGLLDRLDGFELPEIAVPAEPPHRPWKPLSAATISFGHGVATTPLQTAVAAAAMVNGGRLVPPTLMPRSRAQADGLARRVISQRTSDKMRHLFRLNSLVGSGRRAEVPGYVVGGKTGTADKAQKGGYATRRRFNAFLSAFPLDRPRYVVLVTLDEPKPEKKGVDATAGMNTAPTVGRIVRRAAALLGVRPDMRVRDTGTLANYRP